MKMISNLKKIFLLFIATTAIISCDNDDAVSPQPVDNSIAGIASRDAQFTVLVSALSRAGLVGTLQGTGPFTVFAPTNAAFEEFLDDNGFANLEAVPVPVLKEILLNHVISGSLQSTALTTGYIKTLAKGAASTTNTLSMFVNTADGVVLNGVSEVTTANVIATNGVIHVVDAVIGLPTIVTHAVANPAAFSTLVSVVTSVGPQTATNPFGDQSAILAALSAATPAKTVFAPVNAAFAAAIALGAWANGATSEQLSRVLLYHVTTAGNVTSNTLTQGQVIPMASTPQQNTTIDLVGGAKVVDSQSLSSNIVVVDVQCSNGIVHAVDRVLRPF